MKKSLIISALLGAVVITPASAYTYSFANTLKVPVMIQVGGLGAGNMFGGHEDNKARRHDYGKHNIRYDWAQKLRGPVVIPPLTTIDYHFANTKVGVCLNTKSFQLGVNGGQMLPRQVYRIPNDWTNKMLESVDNFSQSLGSTGQAVSSTSSDPRAQAVGAGISAIAGMIPTFARLDASNMCKSAKFIIYEDTTTKEVVLGSDSYS